MGVTGEPAIEPPPQAIWNITRLSRTTSKSDRRGDLFLALPPFQPRPSRAIADSGIQSAYSGMPPGRSLGGASRADVGAVVEMVKAEVTGLPPGMTLLGENEQLACAGRPEQASVTVLPYSPNRGLKLTV